MKRFLLLGFLVSLVIGVYAEPLTLSLTGQDIGHPIDSGVFIHACQASLQKNKFRVSSMKEGIIIATFTKGRGMGAKVLTISITYDVNTYSINYLSSKNLNEWVISPTSILIHKNVNTWILRVDRDIAAAYLKNTLIESDNTDE